MPSIPCSSPKRSHHYTPSWMVVAGLLCVVSLAVGRIGPLHAQAASATLKGTVLDETGALVSGVSITAENVATRYRRVVTTDRVGTFTIAFMPPGRYVIGAERAGFARGEVRDVTLNVNDQIAIEIELKVASAAEAVTVVSAPRRASVSPGVGTVVDRQFIANMPLNGRSLQSLLQTVPGVVMTPVRETAGADGSSGTGAAQFSVNGQRATANYFVVDGVSANTGIGVAANGFAGASGAGQTPGTTALGGTNSLVSLDALQEFRMETSTFAPEFGRTPGGQISLVTRGGTNSWHGTLSEYFRHDAMDANDWFGNSRNLAKPQLRQHMFGGVLGGPIQRDKLFVFGSYEGLRLKQPKTTLTSVPSVQLRQQAPAALRPYLAALPLPNGRILQPGAEEFGASYSDEATFDVSSVRVDAHVTDALTGFIRINHAPSDTRTRTRALSTIANIHARNDSVTGGVTWIAGAKLTGDLKANWTRNKASWVQDLDTFGGAVVPAESEIFLPGRDTSSAQTLFSAFGSGFNWGIGTADQQRQVNVVGTMVWLVGSHQLKMGVDYRRLMPLLGGNGASYENAVFLTADRIVSGMANSYQLTSGDPRQREARFTNLSLYAQDAWRPTRRLTVTYGVRFEHVPRPTEATGRPPTTLLGIDQPVLDNPRLAPEGTPLWSSRRGELAPRLGGAYQVIARPGWEATLRSGIGLFYDLGVGSIATAFQDVYPYYASISRANASFPPSGDLRVPPQPGVVPPSRFNLLDPNVELPYTTQWHAAWEQSLGHAQTVTLSYVGAAGERLLAQQAYRQSLAEWPTVRTLLFIQRNVGESEYNALQFQYQRRLTRGVQALAAYTFAHARDNGSADDALVAPASQADLLAREWAPSDYDVRHVTSLALTYDIPGLPGAGLLRQSSQDWGVDLLVRSQSGLPLTPLVDTPVLDGMLFSQRPDEVPGQSLYLDDPTVPGGRRLNRAAFTAPTGAIRQGTFPRNALRSFGAWQVDLAVRRQLSLGGSARLQFRAELFNLLNHPNFGPYVTALNDPLFGQPRQMLNQSLTGLNGLYQMGGSRSGQLAVKFSF
jgi:hypothetical protein